MLPRPTFLTIVMDSDALWVNVLTWIEFVTGINHVIITLNVVLTPMLQTLGLCGGRGRVQLSDHPRHQFVRVCPTPGWPETVLLSSGHRALWQQPVSGSRQVVQRSLRVRRHVGWTRHVLHVSWKTVPHGSRKVVWWSQELSRFRRWDSSSLSVPGEELEMWFVKLQHNPGEERRMYWNDVSLWRYRRLYQWRRWASINMHCYLSSQWNFPECPVSSRQNDNWIFKGLFEI